MWHRAMNSERDGFTSAIDFDCTRVHGDIRKCHRVEMDRIHRSFFHSRRNLTHGCVDVFDATHVVVEYRGECGLAEAVNADDGC